MVEEGGTFQWLRRSLCDRLETTLGRTSARCGSWVVAVRWLKERAGAAGPRPPLPAFGRPVEFRVRFAEKDRNEFSCSFQESERPPTRIPATTQTRHRTRLDPISTT